MQSTNHKGVLLHAREGVPTDPLSCFWGFMLPRHVPVSRHFSGCRDVSLDTILQGPVGTGLLLPGINHTLIYVSVVFRTLFLPSILYLICGLTSSDVSVSTLRARLVADAIGTMAVVEELAIPPPTYQTSSISAAAG